MLRKLILASVALGALSAPCFADSFGSAVGGAAGNQSSMAGGVYLSSPASLSNGQQAGFAIDPTTHGMVTVPAAGGPAGPVTITPSATVGVTTQSCSTACASTLISGAHSLYGFSASATVAGWVLIYDAASCSTNGTVTPKKAYAYTVANSSLGVSWSDIPMVNATGIAICFSSTGPYTATASTTAFLSADYK